MRHRFFTFLAVFDRLGGRPFKQPEPDVAAPAVGFLAFMASNSFCRVERPLRTTSSLSLVSVVVSKTTDGADLDP